MTLAVPVVGLALLSSGTGPVPRAVAVGLLLLAAWPGLVMLGLLVLRRWLTRGRAAAGSGAVIVLGTPVPDGEVGEELAARLRGGLAALAALPVPTAAAAALVLTGGRGGKGRPAEAVAMESWVRREDPTAPVVLEDRATTTEENLLLSTALLEQRGAAPPYAVVTSAYHAARTRLLVARHRLPLRVVGVVVPMEFAPGAYLRELLIVLKQWRRPHAAAALVILLSAVLAGLAVR
ncbi:YdcF family protein [Serinicoccus kebangsaanensis]|uniref:YdcF family protein n=1 Tax=Serinicoccus kebangsaanensis TaxID=2602069 RepID=UPI00124F4505|nr:YdcF family protein [Serinicoccus kebangsaanensis]